MAQRIVHAVHDVARQAAESARTEHLGTVVQLNPMQVELHDSFRVLDEDEQLTLTQWVKYYDKTTGIDVGDNVLVSKRSGEWFVVDVTSENDVVTP